MESVIHAIRITEKIKARNERMRNIMAMTAKNSKTSEEIIQEMSAITHKNKKL